MNGTITQVKNRRSTHQVEISFCDEQGQPAGITLTPEQIVDLYLASQQVKNLQEDRAYAWQNAKLLDELIDYLDIISEVDFSKQFPDDPKTYQLHWAEWRFRYHQQRKARAHFFQRKGEQL